MSGQSGRDVEQKHTWVLEMTHPDDLRPAEPMSMDVTLMQVEDAFPELNWLMHQVVGADYRWGGRWGWGRERWTQFVDQPEFQTWVAYVKGAPAGYFELLTMNDGSVQIICFGLRKEYFGQGLGGCLLNEAVRCCWAMGANKVWLTTCSHDHPLALSNYKARGFRVVEERDGPSNPVLISEMFGGRE